jgi:hypothetical protein
MTMTAVVMAARSTGSPPTAKALRATSRFLKIRSTVDR